MPTIYCRHIRPSGRRCQTPALRGKPFCFHHATVNAHHRILHPPDDGTCNLLSISDTELDQIRREPIVAEYFANARGPVVLDFPPLEDANSVQLALSMVLTVLGQNRIDPRRAAAMLYNLQIASGNARNLTHNETQVVRDFVHDEAGTLLSPDEDPEEIQDRQRLLEELEESRKETDKLMAADEDEEYDEDEEDD